MKNYLISICCFIAFVCLLSSCESIYSGSLQKIRTLSVKADAFQPEVTKETAMTVALSYLSEHKYDGVADDINVVNVKDSYGRFVAYAVNYSDKGYVLVSSSRNVHPILAFSKEGCFDESYINNGSSVLIDEPLSFVQRDSYTIQISNPSYYHINWCDSNDAWYSDYTGCFGNNGGYNYSRLDITNIR